MDKSDWTKEEIEAMQEALLEAQVDPINFINDFCYTFDPRRSPSNLPFYLFPYQKDLVKEVKSAIDYGYDLFVEKPRDMGVSYTVLDVFLWFWRYIEGSNFIVGSRKQDYVDSTGSGSSEVSNKEESLFGKMEYTLRHLPPIILPNKFNFNKDLTFMSLINPEIGNAIIGESANPNFSRSGRFRAVLLDEFAFWEHDFEAWSATADSSNCRIVVTTPGTKPNTKAERLRFHKDGEEIKIFEIDFKQDPRKDAAWEEKERSRRSAEDFAREIGRNWTSSVKGKVYEEIKNAVVGNYPFNPRWPLYISWDFGIDGTAIQWWQPNLSNGKMRIVDSFFYEGHPIQYSFPVLGEPIDSSFTYSEDDLQAIKELKDLPSGVHYGDPDVSKKAYQSKVMTSTRKELEAINVYVQTKPESNDFFTRKEKTKVLLQRGVEVNNTIRNLFWLECIRNSRFPQRSENSESTSATTLPVHDRNSHHRTATKYLAVNYDLDDVAVEAKIQQAPSWYNPQRNFNTTGIYRGRRR